MKKNGQTHRLNLELGPNARASLDRLQDTLEARTQVEVIRVALQILAQLVEATEDGAAIVIERKGGRPTELMLPLLRRRPEA